METLENMDETTKVSKFEKIRSTTWNTCVFFYFFVLIWALFLGIFGLIEGVSINSWEKTSCKVINIETQKIITFAIQWDVIVSENKRGVIILREDFIKTLEQFEYFQSIRPINYTGNCYKDYDEIIWGFNLVERIRDYRILLIVFGSLLGFLVLFSILWGSVKMRQKVKNHQNSWFKQRDEEIETNENLSK